MRRLALFSLLFVLCSFSLPLHAAGRGEPGEVVPVQVFLRDRTEDLRLFNDLDLDVDGVFGTWARIHLLPEEIDKLAALGYAMASLPADPDRAVLAGEGSEAINQYHTYETLTAELQQIAADHANIVRLSSIGKSVHGRELWMVRITDNPDVQEDEPEVRYIAAMHGDEVVGKELSFNLIDLLTNSYGTDPRITQLVDTTEIWILPSMNPDGTAAGRRYNANNYDLNRNFPDEFDDPVDSTAGRQPETARVMDHGFAESVVLSANFHGGTVVANYPRDGNAAGSSIYSPCPDDALFVSLSRTYADLNPAMRTSNSDPSYTNGICNGADWYVIYGGLQDWNYVWHGNREITLEVTATKWPAASTLPGHWNDNREAMLAYLERVHAGVRGIVRDVITGAPLSARIHVAGTWEGDTFTDPQVGDYHRVLLPGRYDLEVSATGYASAFVRDVVVASGPAVRRDVDLLPLAVALQPDGARVLDAGNGALDPGEATDLAVTLRNLGSAATAIGAALVPTGWYAEATRAEASYPDLGPGASGESIAPHFGVAVSPAVPAGHKLGFAVRWTASEGTGLSEPFFLPAAAAACATVASTDVPRTVLDRQAVESVLPFPEPWEIETTDVYVDVGHPYSGDLRVTVLSPAGTPVALHQRSGGSADDVTGWFDDQRVPAEPLSRLEGEGAAGTWKLRVSDDIPSNTGTLRAWSLRVCGRPFEAGMPEMKFRLIERGRDGEALLTWWPYPGATSYRVYRSTSPQPGSFVEVGDGSDTAFTDPASGDLLFWKVSAVGPNGEGPR